MAQIIRLNSYDRQLKCNSRPCAKIGSVSSDPRHFDLFFAGAVEEDGSNSKPNSRNGKYPSEAYKPKSEVGDGIVSRLFPKPVALPLLLWKFRKLFAVRYGGPGEQTMTQTTSPLQKLRPPEMLQGIFLGLEASCTLNRRSEKNRH